MIFGLGMALLGSLLVTFVLHYKAENVADSFIGKAFLRFSTPFGFTLYIGSICLLASQFVFRHIWFDTIFHRLLCAAKKQILSVCSLGTKDVYFIDYPISARVTGTSIFCFSTFRDLGAVFVPSSALVFRYHFPLGHCPR